MPSAAVASEMGCGQLRNPSGAVGRANLLATENCCVLVDDELLKQINCNLQRVASWPTALNFTLCGGRPAHRYGEKRAV